MQKEATVGIVLTRIRWTELLHANIVVIEESCDVLVGSRIWVSDETRWDVDDGQELAQERIAFEAFLAVNPKFSATENVGEVTWFPVLETLQD